MRSPSRNVPSQEEVPRGLRRAFVAHFAVDLAVAIPLLVAPRPLLTALGWTAVDPAMSRVVAAALFAIGIHSYRMRNEHRGAYVSMLELKLLWSSFALLGVVASLLRGETPPTGWAAVGLFALFSALWWNYRLRLGPCEEALP